MMSLLFAIQGMVRAFRASGPAKVTTYGGELNKAHKRIAELEKRLYGVRQ